MRYLVLCLLCFEISLEATTFTVTSVADSGANTLRDALLNAQPGDTINIMSGLVTINIGSTTNTALPILTGVTINGNNNTISGQDTYPIFMAFSGTNTINDLALTHGKGLGGNGGAGGGGGGGALGAGGALFVNTGATASTSNVSFSNNTVQGGNGGSVNGTKGGGGGGGGYNSNGGDTTSGIFGVDGGGGGGGGVFDSLGGSSASSGGGGGGINNSSGGITTGPNGLSGGGGGGVNQSNGGMGGGGGGGGGGINVSVGGDGSSAAFPTGGGGGGGGGFGTIAAGVITSAPGATTTGGGGGGGGGLGTAGLTTATNTGGTGGAGGGGTGGNGTNVGLAAGGAGTSDGANGGGGGGGASVSSASSSGTGGFGGSVTNGGGGGGGVSATNSASGNSGFPAPTGNGGSSSTNGGGGGGAASFSFNARAFGPAGKGGNAAIGGGGGGGATFASISTVSSSAAGAGGSSSVLGGGGGGGPAIGSGGAGGLGGSGGLFGGGGGGGASYNAAAGAGGSGGTGGFGGGGGGGALGISANGTGAAGGFGAGSGGNRGVAGGGGSAFGGAVFLATGATLNLTDGSFSTNTVGPGGTGSSMGSSEGADFYLMSGTVAGYTVTDSNSVTLANTVGGAGSVAKLGSGTLVLGNTGNTFLGGVVLDGGIVSISNNGNLGGLAGDITFNGGTLQLTMPLTIARAVITNSSGVIDTGVNNSSFSGNISGDGSLTKIGSGLLTLSDAANTYLGGTTINDGTLSISDDGNLGNSSGTIAFANGATLQLTGPLTSSRSVLLNSPTGGAIDTGTFTSTFTGNFSGNGSFTKLGTGSLLLDSQSNSYIGGTTVSAGTLQGDTNSLQGSIVDLATVVFNQSTTGTFNGQLTSGTGTVIKTGTGKINFVNNSAGFGGHTDVQQGELSLNTTLGGDVIIQAGAILSGNGIITGNGTIHGTITPGNSIGTLTFNGNYVQAAGSNYNVQVNGASQSSQIQSSGTATIDANTSVVATSADGTVRFQFPYLILHANGGRTGTFSSVSYPSTLIIPTLTYDANGVYLTLTQNITSISGAGNTLGVAGQLDKITDPTLAEQTFLSQLIAESPEQAHRSLDQLSAEQYTNILLSSVLANHQFITRLYEPLRAVLTARCPQNCAPVKIWGEGGRSYYSLRGNQKAEGFSATGTEGTVGVHGTVMSHWTLGSAVSFEWTHFNYKLSGYSNRSNVLGSLYSVYRPCHYYILSDLLVGYTSGSVKRSVDMQTQKYQAHGNPKTFQNTLYVEAGADVKWRRLILQPFLGIDGGYYRFNGFTEQGNDPIQMVVKGRSLWAAYNRLGLHLNADPMHRFFVNMDLAWQCRLTPFDNDINERFKDFGGNFTVQGINLPRNSFVYSANLAGQVRDCIQVFGQFNGENWNKGFSYSWMIGVKIN